MKNNGAEIFKCNCYNMQINVDVSNLIRNGFSHVKFAPINSFLTGKKRHL